MPHILVIDDDLQMRLMLQQVLTRAGYAASLAANGKEGISLHEKTPADLIITDVIMPEKEGIESIQEIRKRWPETRIIAISGGLRGGNLDLLSLARMLGAARTLAKPFKHEDLLNAIREILAAPSNKRFRPREKDPTI